MKLFKRERCAAFVAIVQLRLFTVDLDIRLSSSKWSYFDYTSLTFVNCAIPIAGNVGYFWHVADFHYDFTYDTGSGVSCIPAVPVGNRSMFGHHWCDSNWRLVRSAVQAMKQFEPNADFIIWTGDSAPHAPPQRHMLNRVNTLEILQNITDLIETVMPATPLYAVLGNNDIVPNYQFPPSRSYVYNATWIMWGKWIPDHQIQSYLKGGYYRKDLGNTFTVLALNTNLYASKNKETEETDDPADQFSWMENQLEDIRKNRRTAVVMGHVGPGVCPIRGQIRMHDNHHTRFLVVLSKYSDVIQAVYVAHDHDDRFLVFNHKVPIYFGLAVTPWRYMDTKTTALDRNPGIRLISYDRNTGKQLDIHQYYLDLTKANKDRVAEWKSIYNLTNILGIKDLSAESLSSFWKRLKNNPDLTDTVLKMSVARMNLKTRCDKSCRDAWYCSIGHLTVPTYKKCLKV